MQIRKIITLALAGLAIVSLTCAWRWNPAARVKVDKATEDVATLSDSNTAQNTRLDNVESTNTSQNTRLDTAESTNTSQNTRLDTVTSKGLSDGILTATQAGPGTNNIVLQVKDSAGNAPTTNCLVRLWTSATQFGAASSNTALSTAMTGTILRTHTTGCDWDFITTVAGAGAIHMVEADATYAITNWVMIEVGGFIGSVKSVTAIP